MHKSLFAMAVLCLTVSAQDITVSKDSIRVYNNLAMSFADEVVFTSHASAAVHLDSARIAISEMDTVGFSHAISINGFQACWRTNVPSFQSFVWTMDVTGPNTYLLTKNIFDPGSAEPLVFSGNNTTSQIVGLEIGMFLFGETRPQYPKYIKGTLRLFFSNGQVVELRLWSQDLRTAVKPKNFSTTQPSNSRRFGVPEGVSTSSRSYRYLVNGRRVTGSNKQMRIKHSVRDFKPR
jgi:hypothetical protein